MLHSRLGKELVVRSTNDIELLWEMSKRIAEKGVNILAVSGAASGTDCTLRLVTDDNLRAKDVLVGARYAPHEEGVVVVELPHKPGMLKRIVETLAKEGIEIHHLFATAVEESEKSLLVFHSSNDAHALVTLKGMETEEHAVEMAAH